MYFNVTRYKNKSPFFQHQIGIPIRLFLNEKKCCTAFQTLLMSTHTIYFHAEKERQHNSLVTSHFYGYHSMILSNKRNNNLSSIQDFCFY